MVLNTGFRSPLMYSAKEDIKKGNKKGVQASEEKPDQRELVFLYKVRRHVTSYNVTDFLQTRCKLNGGQIYGG